MAATMGLRAGWSLDLTTVDPDDGRPWDFSDPEKRAKARKMLERDGPVLLVVCPMCSAFSVLQELFNYPRMSAHHVESKLSEGLDHLRFAVELCIRQHNAGRLFLFEHPHNASSWSTKALNILMGEKGVYKVDFDFCMLGMEARGDDGVMRPAKKRTGVVTNSEAVASVLERAQCRNEHEHVHLLGGKAGPCQIYPDKFCRLVCEGVKQELAHDRCRNST